MIRLIKYSNRPIKLNWGKFLQVAGAVFLTAAMLKNPHLVFEGASYGLKTWWNIVFPSLLPFFIISELLMNFGIVHFLGTLLEPLMRPLFNVPGAGSLVVAIGFTSGYPIGSMVTAKLRSQGLCTKTEAERLISFTNNSSPLFMLVAVAVGMFHNPKLGTLIATAHYLASITIGIALRFYKRETAKRFNNRLYTQCGHLQAAVRQLLQKINDDKRSAGTIIGDAVSNAVSNLLNIGGFIILFAVIIRLLDASGVIDFLAKLLGFLLFPFKFSPGTLRALASGLFEITTGTKLASEIEAPLTEKLIAVSMILGWSGLCVHTQAAAMLRGTDIGMKVFYISRVFHACLAGIYTFILLKLPVTAIQTAYYTGKPAHLIFPANKPLFYSFRCLESMVAILLAMVAINIFLNAIKIIYHLIKKYCTR